LFVAPPGTPQYGLVGVFYIPYEMEKLKMQKKLFVLMSALILAVMLLAACQPVVEAPAPATEAPAAGSAELPQT